MGLPFPAGYFIIGWIGGMTLTGAVVRLFIFLYYRTRPNRTLITVS